MTVALIFCAVIAVLSAAATTWAFCTILELARTINDERDELDAERTLYAERVSTLQRTIDQLTGDLADHIAGLDEPAPVKKAAARKAPAAKKGPAK